MFSFETDQSIALSTNGPDLGESLVKLRTISLLNLFISSLNH